MLPIPPSSRRAALLGLSASSALLALGSLTEAASAAAPSPRAGAAARMPVIFIGHGSPMNAIRENAFTRSLRDWGEALPRPAAILSVSAHWLTHGVTGVGIQAQPRTIHDFSGFPDELHRMQYPAPGAPELAQLAADTVKQRTVHGTDRWGLDHGTWTVLRHLYPKADVPVFQLSIDYDQPAAFHYSIGRELAVLRERGVLVLGSGNVVHNLRATERHLPEAAEASRPWARGYDLAVKRALDGRDDRALIGWQQLSMFAAQAVPTPDHYYPLLYALGAAAPAEPVRHVFEGFHSGTLSMRCVQFG